MTTLIFGGGLLGRELIRHFNEVSLVTRDQCDIRQPEAVLRIVERLRDLTIINAAAYTNVDKSESEPREAFAVNALGARNVADAARRAGARLLHVSTNAVFDGLEGAFDETCAPQTASVYGYTKLVGEEYVRDAGGEYIVRVAFTYGKYGKNFGSTLFNRLRAGGVVPADPIRRVTPTWAQYVAKAVQSMLEKRVPPGIYHAVSTGAITWYEFARMACRPLNANVFRVEPTLTPKGAPRPDFSIMVSRKLQMFDIDVPDTYCGMQAAIEDGV